MSRYCPVCCGDVVVVCQKCGRISCSNPNCPRGMNFEWRPDLYEQKTACLTCEKCQLMRPPKVVSDELNRLLGRPMSLGEHCRIEFRQEFGRVPTDQELRRYINRHYGHG